MRMPTLADGRDVTSLSCVSAVQVDIVGGRY